MGPRRVVIAEDCNEFRLLQVAGGEGSLGDWLDGYLAPEGIAVADYRDRLLALGNGWSFDAPADRAELLASVADAEVVLTEREPIDAELIAAAPRLRRIVKFGTDLRNVDRDAAAAGGAEVIAVPRMTTSHVADHVLMLALVLLRGFTGDARLRHGDAAPPPAAPGVAVEAGAHPPTVFNWSGVHGLRALRGRRLAIVGVGETGRAVIQRALAFDVEVGYWSRNRDPELESATGARFLEREALPEWADVVSLHVPYAPALKHFVDADFLRALGPDGVLVNCARGLLADLDAVVEAVRGGTIAAAALDVFPQEPYAPSAQLDALPNLVMTPHLAAADRWAILEDVELVFAALDPTDGGTA
jgi:lactate dehydrogenase-like 2-hydroxyacid dehydrogenase